VRLAGQLLLVLLGALLAIAACGAPQPALTPRPSPMASGDPPPPQPPIAVLTFPGGQPTAGDLGSYAFRGAGSDSPWLPGEPIAVPPAGALGEVFLSEPLRVASWWARVAPAGRVPGTGEVREIGAGDGAIAFELPAGGWTLQLTVQFGDGIGDATWYWQLGQG
jgi:hypothetical protein